MNPSITASAHAGTAGDSGQSLRAGGEGVFTTLVAPALVRDVLC